jgi:hypothetical protein
MTLRDSIPDPDELEEVEVDWSEADAPFNLEDRKQWLAELQNDT